MRTTFYCFKVIRSFSIYHNQSEIIPWPGIPEFIYDRIHDLLAWGQANVTDSPTLATTFCFAIFSASVSPG